MTKLTVVPSGERAVTITRVFRAPRQMVWDAHTQPALVKRWLFGPAGWSLPHCEIDLRVGGKYRYVWRHDDGREMGMGGTFHEIVAPRRLVTDELFDEDWTGGPTVVAQDFVESHGVTTLTMTITYATTAAREGALKTGMARGMEAGYARLDALVAESSAG